jgi:hypothetical protein
MGMRKTMLKYGATVASVFAAGSAMAAVPTSVSDALTTATTDVGTVAAAVLGVYIAILSFRFIRKAI